jgi:hypothetical protein
MDTPTNPTPEEAAEFAAHKAKSAQAAVELSREVHQMELIRKTAQETKAALLEGLKEVFGEGDERKNPQQMRILVRRIPIICNDITDMKKDISDINGNVKWTVRIIIAAVLLAVMKLVLIR